MAARQEQEPARTEVEEVAKNVLRMQLPISLPGLGHVNCYALVDDRGAAVVDPGLPTPASFAALRQRLARVADIRDFASRELALPDNDTFRGYADLHRPYVVWNVFAAAEFSLDPVQWCFPFAGCVAYRGYFSEEGAQRFGAKLQDDGLDVFVGGVPAYSTLGWFNDPVLIDIQSVIDLLD